MRLLIMLVLALFASPVLAQVGEVKLSWDSVSTLCSGNAATSIEYHVFWSLTPRSVDVAPPNHYENNAFVGVDQYLYTVNNLNDCVDYYFAVAAKSDTTWSGCSQQNGGIHIDGYSTEIVSMARPRLDIPPTVNLERARSYTLNITGFNFIDGTFTDAGSVLTWSVPTVSDCNNLAVQIDVPATAPLGSVDVTFVRNGDSIAADLPAYFMVVDNTDAPSSPTNIRRTQPIP
jgi:hypothetical protein